MSTIPGHWIHIYQRPKQGESFITRKQALKYQHQKQAVGGDDTMSCEIGMRSPEAQIALENWIGCRVATYVDNPAAPVWEGIISRVYYDDGTLMVTRSLEEMFNRVEMIFTTVTSGQEILAAANDTASQAIYGIKLGTCEGFINGQGLANNAAHMTAIRNLIINQVSWPLTSVQQSSGTPLFRIEAIGFYHTLKWETFYNIAAGALTPSTMVTTLLGALANGTTFLDNTDTSMIDTNAAYTLEQQEVFGRTAWQALQRVVGGGDGSSYWVAGVSRTNPITGTRRLYYRASNTDVEYTCRAADGLRPRNQYGGLVRPWAMEADRGMRVNDLLVGWAGRGIDPRETYVEALRYDADSQTVTWAGADDLHMQGALQLNRWYKMHGTDFGAQPRTFWL